MKNILCFLLVIIGLQSYGQQPSYSFPIQIQNTKTDNHVRFGCRNAYLVIPNDYLYINEQCRYWKGEQLSIGVIEVPTPNFIEMKKGYVQKWLASKAKGVKTDVPPLIKINEYEGIYTEYVNTLSDKTQLMLTFGDNNFTCIVIGICKTDDSEGKKELHEIMKSIYYEKP